MKGDNILYFLGKCVEPSGHVILVRAPGGQTQLFNIKTGHPWCPHLFDKSHIRDYLRHRVQSHSLCPLCDKLKRNRMGWKLAGGKLAHESLDPPPAYIKAAIEHHFSDRKIPDTLYVDTSDIYQSEEGVFADRPIVEDEKMGRYTGRVYWDSLISEKSDKVMQLLVWGDQSVFVDSSNAWPGKMTHKWNWPYSGEEGIPLVFQEPEFAAYFSNAFVSLEGDITAQVPYHRETTVDQEGNTIGIEEAEEVTIDYGEEYWGDYWATLGIKPYWDLRGAPDALVNLIIRPTVGRELLYNKGRVSTLVLSKEWKGEVDERFFTVVYP